MHNGVAITIDVGSFTVTLRRACRADVPALAALITADPVAQARGDVPRTDPEPYFAAFDAIDADPSELLVVVEHDGDVVGTLQLSFLSGLARRGALRAQVEAVRVRDDHRGSGLGGTMMRWVVDEAERRGCALVQLTSDDARPDARRFYRRLGFVASRRGVHARAVSLRACAAGSRRARRHRR